MIPQIKIADTLTDVKCNRLENMSTKYQFNLYLDVRIPHEKQHTELFVHVWKAGFSIFSRWFMQPSA